MFLLLRPANALVQLAISGFLLSVTGTPAPAQQKPASTTLVVTVSGVHERSGLLRVSLYAKQGGFWADASKALETHDILLNNLPVDAPLNPLRVTFDNLPPGTYTVSSIHNSSGGSKQAARLSDAHFDEAQFTLAAGESKAVAVCVRH